jgi:Rha family phage regulatory protein
MEQLVITNPSGRDVTTSLIVAKVFGKRHENVLRDIRNLKCSKEFSERNFELCLNTKQLEVGSTQEKVYEITKNGFAFLVMGYTGEKAGSFKEMVIAEFNKMDSLLRNDDYTIQRAISILSERTKLLEIQMEQKNDKL